MDNIPSGLGFTIPEGLRAIQILENSETARDARQRLCAEVVTPPTVERINRFLGTSHDQMFYVSFLMRAWIDAVKKSKAKPAQWV